jgi:membrane protein implicated in regulation of membrane protease activity
MSDTLTLMMQIQPWHWFALGIVLLIAEVLTGTTYLLWPAAAATVTAAFALFAPGEAAAEWVVFAVLTIALTLAGHFYVRGRWLKPRAGDTRLNERSSTLIGEIALAQAPFQAGHGQVKLNDTIWRASSGEAIGTGDRVEVVAVDGALLLVKRAV